MFSLFSKFNNVFSMNNQIHNIRSAQSVFLFCFVLFCFFVYFFLSPCRTNTSTVYTQVPKFYNSLNEWMDGWREGGREGGRDERTNERRTE